MRNKSCHFCKKKKASLKSAGGIKTRHVNENADKKRNEAAVRFMHGATLSMPAALAMKHPAYSKKAGIQVANRTEHHLSVCLNP